MCTDDSFEVTSLTSAAFQLIHSLKVRLDSDYCLALRLPAVVIISPKVLDKSMARILKEYYGSYNNIAAVPQSSLVCRCSGNTLCI
jgi:hypothetical protein